MWTAASGAWEGDGACIPDSMQRAVRSYQRGLLRPEEMFKPACYTAKYRPSPRGRSSAELSKALGEGALS